jgi:protein-disulfide isomerase
MSAPPDTDKRGIQAIAQNLGLDWERMKHDMDDPAVAARLQANLTLAHELGIEGTPALVIGGNLIPGAIDLADLQSAVAAARDVKQGAREGN